MNAVKNEVIYETTDLIREFIELNKHLECAGTMEDAVFQFFGGRFYTDKTYEYQKLSVWMLAALAKPEVRKVMKKEFNAMFEDMIDLFERLHGFAETMSAKTFDVMADLDHLENHATGEEPYLIGMHQRYKMMVAGAKAAKAIKDQYKPQTPAA